MAQYDYYRRVGEPGFWLNCQADFMSGYDTRFVVPLLPLGHAPVPAARLNPLFEIDRETHSLVTQFAGAVPAAELREPAGSLAHHDFTISNALDFLLTGI